MKKSLIQIFTGYCYIIAKEGDKYYYSDNTEKHDFTEMDEDIYESSFSNPLVMNIINL